MFSLYLSLAACLSLHAETNKTLLRIDGNAISVDEFTYYFQRSAQKQGQTPEQYFPCFLDFKLKVAEAKRMKLDTLPDFQNQYRILQAALLKSLLTDEVRKNELCHSLYTQQASRLSLQDWVKAEIITLRLPQHATAAEEKRTRQTADSIYAALNRGASFSELTRVYSAKANQAPIWQPKSRLLDEIAQQLSHLSVGSYSQPFYSPLGIHIVKLNGQKSSLNVEEYLPWLSHYIMQHKFDTLLKQPLYKQWLAGTLDTHTLPFRELYEGLLATYHDVCFPETEPTLPSNKELENYFKKHKANYQWELPHFRGAVIHCKDKKAASKIKKYLKKLPEESWKARLTELSKTHPELQAQIETGLFQIGSNSYVDKLAFKCGTLHAHPELPHTFIIGKRLKKGPEKYTDVRESVEKDYLKQAKAAKNVHLRQQFNVEINQYVLKTVNCSGNN